MDIFDYFESLRRGIQQNHTIGFLEEPALLQAFDDHRGLFRARVFFWGSHYPDFGNFPHHKHLGPDETPEPSQQPRLNQVFAQIEEILQTGSDES